MSEEKKSGVLSLRTGVYTIGMIVLVIFVSIVMRWAWPPEVRQTNTHFSEKSSFNEILKRGTIRCGYVSNPPSCIVDPATGKVTGIFAEVIEQVAENLGLKVEWTEEVGFGSMIEGLEADRYDIVPCAIWPTAARAKHADFSTPLFYSGVGVFVRSGDNRFTNDISLINSPDITIATMDGEMSEAIANSSFPKAKQLAIPQLSEISTLLLNVKDKKADVAFVELYFANEFLEKNPGSVVNITPNKPIRIFPNTVLLKADAFRLKAVLNTSLKQLINLGEVDKLIDKYEPTPGTFYRLRAPYRGPTETSQNDSN